MALHLYCISNTTHFNITFTTILGKNADQHRLGPPQHRQTIMTSLNVWTSGRSRDLLAVAREIESKDLWRGFLTIQEHQVVQKVLENDAMWDNLVEGKLSIFVDNPLPDPPLGFRQEQENAANNNLDGAGGAGGGGARLETPTPSTPVVSTSSSSTHLHLKHLQMNQPSPTPSNEGFQKTVSLDCVALAFKVRHMIFDKSVPLLYPNVKGGDLEVDIEDIMAERRKEDAPAQIKAAPVREEEDDYDFDDEDEGTSNNNNNSNNSSKDQQQQQNNNINKDGSQALAVVDSVSVEDRPATSDDIQKRDSALLARIWQRYHLFENDSEAMDSFLAEEGSQESENAGETNTQEEPTKANFGAANLSLKVSIFLTTILHSFLFVSFY